MSDNKAFATELYKFLKENDLHGYYGKTPAEDAIAELENYLSDLQMVRETIKDIEEIADTFDDQEYYVSDVKPLVEGLRETQEKLEAEQCRRMVSDTNYEVKHAIHIGDKEILFAVDEKENDGMCYFVGNYTCNDILGQYAECLVSDDFLEAMQVFTDRVNQQIEVMKVQISQSKMPNELFTAEHCYPNDYKHSIDGKIVAIKSAVFRPEYRRGDIQLVLVNGGNGAKANPMGRAVYCYHLNNGEHTRFERYDVLGEVKSEYLPDWAKEKAAEILAGKSVTQPNKEKKDKGVAR